MKAALNAIPLVDKAVNYILGQPDGTLHQDCYITRSMLIYYSSLKSVLVLGINLNGLLKVRSAGNPYHTVYCHCILLGTGRVLHRHIHVS